MKRPRSQVAAYLARYSLPFSVVSDPTLSAYQRFGLGRTSWLSMLRPGVVLRYLAKMLRGWLPRKPGQGEDILQLGGDFVLDAGKNVVYTHPSRDPTDRPTKEELLEAVRSTSRRT